PDQGLWQVGTTVDTWCPPSFLDRRCVDECESRVAAIETALSSVSLGWCGDPRVMCSNVTGPHRGTAGRDATCIRSRFWGRMKHPGIRAVTTTLRGACERSFSSSTAVLRC